VRYKETLDPKKVAQARERFRKRSTKRGSHSSKLDFDQLLAAFQGEETFSEIKERLGITIPLKDLYEEFFGQLFPGQETAALWRQRQALKKKARAVVW
jgi:hypothetical protein